eukprot:TRINITY_DN1209_c0_g1_i3.p1 TRINITY_DN1209_c0_g1~~TRINITY_DN1209_c0_g1_i3.p1  ORF type:complete len:217 (-),score=21.08 TRINITY_DN1209_c0_g1_i3:254-904(-)
MMKLVISMSVFALMGWVDGNVYRSESGQLFYPTRITQPAFHTTNAQYYHQSADVHNNPVNHQQQMNPVQQLQQLLQLQQQLSLISQLASSLQYLPYQPPHPAAVNPYLAGYYQPAAGNAGQHSYPDPSKSTAIALTEVGREGKAYEQFAGGNSQYVARGESVSYESVQGGPEPIVKPSSSVQGGDTSLLNINGVYLKFICGTRQGRSGEVITFICQ